MRGCLNLFSSTWSWLYKNICTNNWIQIIEDNSDNYYNIKDDTFTDRYY